MRSASDPTVRISIPSANLAPGEIERLVRGSMGVALYLSRSSLEERDRIFEFGVAKEQHLWDSRDHSFKVRFLPIEPVFQARIEGIQDKFYLSLPNRTYIQEKIDARFVGLRTSSEAALLKAIGQKMLGLWQIQNQMNPLYEIMSNILMKESAVADYFVHGRRSKEKVSQYLNFLTSIDILDREDGKYILGRMARKHLEQNASMADVYTAMLSESLQKGHAYMSDFLHFTHITPFIRLCNSSYLPSYFADKRLSMTDLDLSEYQSDLYGIKPRPQSRVIARASQMVGIGIFDTTRRGREKPILFQSDEEVFSRYTENWKRESDLFVSAS